MSTRRCRHGPTGRQGRDRDGRTSEGALGHETAHMAPPTSAGRPVRHRLAPARRCRFRPGPSPGLVGGQVDTESEELSRRSSPCAIRGSPSAKRCLSKETHDASKGLCRVDIHRVLVQSNLLESLSQKQPQAAQPAHTCGKPASFGIPTAGMPGWRSAQQRSQVGRRRSRMPEPSALWRPADGCPASR